MAIQVHAAAYARVSTLLGQNPEVQLVNIRQFAEARGLILVQEYVDQGISGAKERRPALDQLLADARRGKFKVLVVSALDRVARNVRHMLMFIDELRSLGVSLISLREAIDLSTPQGQMTLTVLSAVAELERALIAERIRSSLAAKKISALQTGSSWRCGRPSIVTHQLEADVLALREQGVSIRQTAKRLGVSKSSVQRILGRVQKRC